MLINGGLSVNLRSDRKLEIFKLSLTFFTICRFRVETLRFFIPEMSFVCPTMLHIKKLGGMHNKETYAHVYTRACTRIDIRVYAKYAHIIRVCVVRIVLSCTVNTRLPIVLFVTPKYT